MLIDRPQEQMVLFKEIMLRKMTVRDAEKVARRIAYDKVRRKEKMYNPEIVEIEEEVSGMLGTRVHIEKKEKGGRIEIDFFDEESLKNILEVIRSNAKREDPFAKYPISRIMDESVVARSTGDLTQTDLENNFDQHQNSEGQDSQANQSENQQSFSSETPVVETEFPTETEPQIENELQIEVESSEPVADFPEEDTVSHDSDDEDLYAIKDFTI
jgi:hypothetical protein